MNKHDLDFKERLEHLEVSARALREFADRASDIALRVAQDMERLSDDYENYVALKK